MIKIRVLSVFLALLALAYFFQSCEYNLPPDTNQSDPSSSTPSTSPSTPTPTVPTTPTNPPSTQGVAFNPGKYVVSVEIISGPTVKPVYEGTEVDLTGMKIKITYNDGSTETPTLSSANKADFSIEPPYYKKAKTEHKVRYIKEYNTSEAMKFNAPETNDFQLLKGWTIEGDPIVKEFEGLGYEITGVTITGTYTPETTTKTLFPAVESTSGTYYLRFGDTTNQAPTGISTNKNRQEKLSDNIPKYKLAAINISKDLVFNGQITFDDPRFFGEKAKEHWYGHLKDAVIGLVYENNTTLKSIRLAESAMSAPESIELEVYPKKDNGGWGSTPELEFKFKTSPPTSTEITTKLAVPLYNTLASIGFDYSGTTPIVLNGGNSDSDINFLGKAKPYAIYQMNNNKSNTVKKYLFVTDPTSGTISFNLWYINGSQDTAIETNVNPEGILTSSSSASYDKDKKLQNAKVTYNARDGNLTPSVSVPASQSKSATLKVGVTGY